MENNNHTPERELSPEEQLDQLLAAFLSEPDQPVPQAPEAEEAVQEAAPEDVQPDAEAVAEVVALEHSEALMDPAQDMPEIGPDEDALDAVGLADPEELELEQILAETMQDEWSEAPAADETPAEAAEETPQTADTEVPADEAEAASLPVDMVSDLDEEAGEDGEEEEEEEDPLPGRNRGKIRPKNKGKYGLLGLPHFVSTVIWLIIIAFVGVGLGTMAWEVASDVLALDRPEQKVVISIDSEDDLDDVADKLKQAGLVKYPGLFKFYGNLTDAMDSIRRGTFTLSTHYDYHALVDAMSGNANRQDVKVVIPEGYNCKQIFALLEAKGVCPAAELEEAAANAKLGEYWFLEGVERGTAYCLEGYLFPDTYQFYLGDDPVNVLNKLLRNFDRRYTDIMKAKLEVLNENLSQMMRSHCLSEDYIAKHQMTIREIVIIASMIEKETANNAESYNISSVIYNRLTNPGVYPFLNIDATLVYITGHSPLTEEDKKIDSPYNTYLYKGLIPGPISNPSQASLDAALDPENTEYHYYALDPSTGTHHFSKTYQEHLNFLASLNKGEG